MGVAGVHVRVHDGIGVYRWCGNVSDRAGCDGHVPRLAGTPTASREELANGMAASHRRRSTGARACVSGTRFVGDVVRDIEARMWVRLREMLDAATRLGRPDGWPHAGARDRVEGERLLNFLAPQHRGLVRAIVAAKRRIAIASNRESGGRAGVIQNNPSRRIGRRGIVSGGDIVE